MNEIERTTPSHPAPNRETPFGAQAPVPGEAIAAPEIVIVVDFAALNRQTATEIKEETDGVLRALSFVGSVKELQVPDGVLRGKGSIVSQDELDLLEAPAAEMPEDPMTTEEPSLGEVSAEDRRDEVDGARDEEAAGNAFDPYARLDVADADAELVVTP
jgi:hypothetical protein